MKTVKVDEHRRVRLPGVKPGQVFTYEKSLDGLIILTPFGEAEARPSKVRFEKRDGRTVAITDRPFDMKALKRALAEFP